jgi:hypothetical protein
MTGAGAFRSFAPKGAQRFDSFRQRELLADESIDKPSRREFPPETPFACIARADRATMGSAIPAPADLETRRHIVEGTGERPARQY